jgi:regulator of CtrA degradation
VAKLPAGAAGLVQASQELYARVRRLDEGSSHAEPQSSPARSLLNRLERSF